MKKAYLILENGDVYEGSSIGVSGESIGEVVFTTGMGGYMETLTDPGYYGQIITHTFPLIGNYGVVASDNGGSKIYAKGYIVRELCQTGSNFRKEGELGAWLEENGVVGIEGIDTRRLTKTIREYGVMNGMITPSLAQKAQKLERIKEYKIKDAVMSTTCSEITSVGKGKRVVLIDYGASGCVAEKLASRGLEVITVPASVKAEEILALNPVGIVLSGGAGNPTEAKQMIAELKKLNEAKLPTFAYSLGHQLLAISLGGKIRKLKYGHRGASQPVKDLSTGKVHVTSQNHGYVVMNGSLPETVAKTTMINLNDKSCEALEYQDRPAFSVQFDPASLVEPLIGKDLFDKFIATLEVSNA